MNITLLDVAKPGDNKDYNGGFGTASAAGRSPAARLLAALRRRHERFPLMSYGYLAAILRGNGHVVRVVENAVPRDADLVILQASLIRHRLELDFIRRIRRETRARVGIVGPFASVRPDLFLGEADFVVRGEPEAAADRIRDGAIPAGLVESEPVLSLDTLPFPDWSVFPVGRFAYRPIVDRTPFTFIQASRGCPHPCDYCPYKVFGRHRARSPERVVDEIAHLVRTYGIRGLMFRDPCFSLDRERTAEIARGITARGLDLEWGCETRLDHLDEAWLEVCHRSGLRAIKTGIESADDGILTAQGRRPLDRAHAERMLRACDRLGIRVIAFYLIGLEGDTRESVRRTLAYARELNTDFANFTLCTPIPGTGFYERIKDRIFETDWERFDNYHPVFRHPVFPAAELRRIQEHALLSYYFRPRFLWSHLVRAVRRGLALPPPPDPMV